MNSSGEKRMKSARKPRYDQRFVRLVMSILEYSDVRCSRCGMNNETVKHKSEAPTRAPLLWLVRVCGRVALIVPFALLGAVFGVVMGTMYAITGGDGEWDI